MSEKKTVHVTLPRSKKALGKKQTRKGRKIVLENSSKARISRFVKSFYTVHGDIMSKLSHE